MGKSEDLILHTKDRPGHDFRYSLNSKKIRIEFNWKPLYNFERGLEHTISWYTNNKKWRNNISSKDMTVASWKTR